MRKRWRIILPILGLLLFGGGSYVDFRMDKEYPLSSDRYFWWSSIRLNRDPLGRHSAPHAFRQNEDGSVGWDPPTRWVTPGPMAKLLMYSALPAFALAAVAVGALGRLGVSEVTSFMTLMPVLLAAWYYFVGWLVDRRAFQRSRGKA